MSNWAAVAAGDTAGESSRRFGGTRRGLGRSGGRFVFTSTSAARRLRDEQCGRDRF